MREKKEIIFKEIMADNIPELKKGKCPQIEKAHRISN